jgi:hypothetical protein
MRRRKCPIRSHALPAVRTHRLPARYHGLDVDASDIGRSSLISA